MHFVVFLLTLNWLSPSPHIFKLNLLKNLNIFKFAFKSYLPEASLLTSERGENLNGAYPGSNEPSYGKLSDCLNNISYRIFSGSGASQAQHILGHSMKRRKSI